MSREKQGPISIIAVIKEPYSNSSLLNEIGNIFDFLFLLSHGILFVVCWIF